MAGQETQQANVEYSIIAEQDDVPAVPVKEEYVSPFDEESIEDILRTDFGSLYSPLEGILCEGVNFFVGESKLGKSWFSLDLGYHVSEGLPFLGRNTTRSKVLYLALEDSKRRLKDRLRILGISAGKNLLCATRIKDQRNIDNINPALEAWLKANGQNCLIIIDTFAKIKPSSKWNTGDAYNADYKIIGALKETVEKYHSCLLLIHHPRKNKEGTDVFSWINGSNGIMGASDQSIVVRRERMSDEFTFNVTGREFEELEFNAVKDENWHFIAKTEEQTARDKYERNPIVKCLRHMIEVNPSGGRIEYETLIGICKEGGMSVSDARQINTLITNYLEDALLKYDRISVGLNVEMGKGSRKHGIMYYKS